MKKMLLFFFLIFPIFVNAVTYSSATTTAGNYMETGDYKFSYEKYIYTPTNNSNFYNNDSSLFIKGGMLNLDEFRITLKNNTRSLYYSYLYEGNPYWTITTGSTSDERKIINSGFPSYLKTENNTKIGTKVTEYVLPTTGVIGQGSYNDPFIFAPQYKVLIKVNNSERGVIVDANNKEVTTLEFLATESDYREIKIKSKGKYGYIGSTCGFILNDIQSSIGKIIISGVARDTECTINFGERPSAVLLNQDENTTPSNPAKLFIIPENGWFLDEFANYTISTLIKNPTKTGYTYKGYYKSTSSLNACDGILVIGVDKKLIKTKSLLDSFADNQILYPCYVANKYTVTFDKNTGDRLTTTSKTVIFDQKYGELPVPEKDGYKFDGWYTDAVAGELIDSSTVMDLAKSHTLYAHWTADKTSYKVRHFFQKVGAGTVHNSTNYVEGEFKSYQGISDTEVFAIKKDFDGFNTPSDNIKITINRHGTSEVSYYYTRKYFKVTYNLQKLGGPQPSDANVQYQADYPLPTVSEEGYTFEGWYKDQAFTNKITSGEKLTDTSDHQLYARWIINRYTITLNKSDGISSVSGAGTYNYKTKRNITATVKAGYTWYMWAGDLCADDRNCSFDMPAKNITLTARATGNPYSVVYKCNGGSGSANATNHTYGTESNVRTNFCAKTGFYFTGWNTKSDGSGKSVSSGGTITDLTTEYDGIVTLYAQWKPITYNIAFAANGGSGTMSSMRLTYGQVVNLKNNTFTKTGHKYTGWSGSNGNNYANGASVSNLTTVHNSTITMTARWYMCVAGYYLSNNECELCPVGKYSNGGVNSCTPCPPGTYTYTTGLAFCTTCTAGYYCPGDSDRISCPFGTTSNTGATSSSSCYSLTPETINVNKSYFGNANVGINGTWRGWTGASNCNSGYNEEGIQVYVQQFRAPSFSGSSKRLIFRMWGVRPLYYYPSTVTLRYAVTKESSMNLYLNQTGNVYDSNAIGSGYATYTNVSSDGGANWIDVAVDVTGLVSNENYVLILWPYSTDTNHLVSWQVGYHNGITLEYYP